MSHPPERYVGGIGIHFQVLKVSPIQKGVDAMVIEFQHAYLGVGEDEETDLDGQVALDLLLEHLELKHLAAQFFQIMKEETVDGTGHFTLVLLVADLLVAAHVHDKATKSRIAHQLGHLSQDLLIGVRIGGALRRGHKVGERLEPRMGAPLDRSVHTTHHQPFVHIEFQQGHAQQDLVTLAGTDQGVSRCGHDVMLLGEGLHVLAHRALAS